MKLAVAQINTTVGDLAGNIARILDAAEKVREADLVFFPEMTVPGYPPRDMLYDASFIEAVQAATLDLARQAKHLPPLLVFSPTVPGTCAFPVIAVSCVATTRLARSD